MPADDRELTPAESARAAHEAFERISRRFDTDASLALRRLVLAMEVSATGEILLAWRSARRLLRIAADPADEQRELETLTALGLVGDE